MQTTIELYTIFCNSEINIQSSASVLVALYLQTNSVNNFNSVNQKIGSVITNFVNVDLNSPLWQIKW